MVYVPSRICVQLMLLRLALFAIVLVWHLRLLHDSHATAMLPHTAAVTGDEQAARVLCLCVCSAEGGTQWWTRVVLLAAYTSRYLLLFTRVFFRLVVGFDILVCFRGVRTLAATRLIVRVLTGQRVWCS